jgi:hypothetical protein
MFLFLINTCSLCITQLAKNEWWNSWNNTGFYQTKLNGCSRRTLLLNVNNDELVSNNSRMIHWLEVNEPLWKNMNYVRKRKKEEGGSDASCSRWTWRSVQCSSGACRWPGTGCRERGQELPPGRVPGSEPTDQATHAPSKHDWETFLVTWTVNTQNDFRSKLACLDLLFVRQWSDSRRHESRWHGPEASSEDDQPRTAWTERPCFELSINRKKVCKIVNTGHPMYPPITYSWTVPLILDHS